MTYSSRYKRESGYFGVRYPSDHRRYLHSYDLNDASMIFDDRLRRASDAVLRDGQILTGGQIYINRNAGLVTAEAAQVYVAGMVLDVAERRDIAFLTSGAFRIGVDVAQSFRTHEDDPELRGDIIGARTQGEPGADRLHVAAIWSIEAEAVGDFYAIYLIQDGLVLNSVEENPFDDRLARYDREANGHYVVSGYKVKALGYQEGAGEQHYQISEGTVNVWGNKIDLPQSYRLKKNESPDLELAEAEPHIAPANTALPVTILTRHSPITSVVSVTLTRERTETITRGAFAGGVDHLPDTSVSLVVSITQGGVSYSEGVDFSRVGDSIDWSLGGNEPAPGSSYQVVYRFVDVTAPDFSTENSITVSDLVPNSTILLQYNWALPRIDVIAVDRDGAFHYIEGESDLFAPTRPRVPPDWLALASITNIWGGMPQVKSIAPRAVPYAQLEVHEDLIYDLLDLVAQEKLRRDMDARQPTTKRGVFVDPLFDDDMRDQGLTQTASIVNEMLQLPIEANVTSFNLGAPITLPFASETIVDQPLSTSSMKINPYSSFAPLPAEVHLDPAIDQWQATETRWSSPETRNITRGTGPIRTLAGTEQREEVVSRATEPAEFLRPIDVLFEINGFGVGEALQEVTFDGLEVTPRVNPATRQPLAGDANGRLTGVFTIPADIPAGAKRVTFLGAGGTPGVATFIGSGEVTVTQMRQVTTRTWNARRPEPIPTFNDNQGGDGGGDPDPLAQTFVLPSARAVTGFQFKVAAVGDPANHIIAQLRETRDGIVTKATIAEAFLSMQNIVLGEWQTARFDAPVPLLAGVEYAVVLMSDDAEHAVEVAGVGEFDASAEQFVTAQPYQIGVLQSSSNNSTWISHQNRDMTFRIEAARYSQTQMVVTIGPVSLTNCSDLIVAAGVDEPSPEARALVRVTRADGSILTAAPGARMIFDEYLTETVTIDVLLIGTATDSPVLFPWIDVIAGEVQTSGNYITRALPGGSNADQVQVVVTIETLLPSSASVQVRVGQENNWQIATLDQSFSLGEGWIERNYIVENYAFSDVRAEVILNGSPGARPLVRQIRANVTPDPVNIITGQ